MISGELEINISYPKWLILNIEAATFLYCKTVFISPFQLSNKNKNMLLLCLHCLSVLPLYLFLHPPHQFMSAFGYFLVFKLYGRILTLTFFVELHKRKIIDLTSTANLSFSSSEWILMEYNGVL